jgi:hypothetical protein
MDIWIAVKPTNANKIVSALNEFGFDAPELTTDLFLDENKIIQIGVLPVELEIITSISEVEIGTQHE